MGPLSIILAVFILGVLICLHELGHFLAAKRQGVDVITFSIGVGPTLISVDRGGTQYCVKLIPWAGYVKLRGEEPGEDGPPGPGHFETKTPWQRCTVFLAGPAMNLALPFLLMPLVYLLGVSMPAYLQASPEIGWVTPGSSWAQAGLRAGDIIRGVGGAPVSTWEEFHTAVYSAGAPPHLIMYLRGGVPMSASVALTDKEKQEAGTLGIMPKREARVGKVRAGYPAARAGLKAGDLIVSVGGAPIRQWEEMARIIRDTFDLPVVLGLDRGGQLLTATVIPIKDSRTARGIIGVEMEESMIIRRTGLLESFREGWTQVIRYSWLVFYVLGKLLTGQISLSTLGGPIAIADITAQAARSGASRLLDFTAFISLQLGILNLFPFIILDGGQIALVIWEAVLRRKVHPRTVRALQIVGFSLLLTLMVMVTVNDIGRLWGDDLARLWRAVAGIFR